MITDGNNAGCAEYAVYEAAVAVADGLMDSWCGNHDTAAFLSETMCCACGGGSDGDGDAPEPGPTPQPDPTPQPEPIPEPVDLPPTMEDVLSAIAQYD